MGEVKSIKSHVGLTSGSLLARNMVLNILGQGAPLVAAIFAMPILVKELGLERFGVLALTWTVLGYFSLFDVGLGRALTKLVAEKLGAAQEKEIPALIWTALLIMMIMGVIGAVLLGLVSSWLISQVLKIPEGLRDETLRSFFLLAIFIPIVICSIGLRGLLEAHQRFGVINAARINMGVLTFLGPLLVLQFSRNLFWMVALLGFGRLAECLFYLVISLHTMPALRRGIMIQRGAILPLFQYGGWVTVSNIVGPLMVYSDRFLISMSISMAAVAYYVTPYEIVTKLWFIPSAMAGVLFPAFSATSNQNPDRTALLFTRGVKVVFLILFPITLLMTSVAREGLDLWLGREFVDHSTRVLQWLTMAIFINSMAHIPYALIQASGRPDLTAKLHVLELPFYLAGVWWMIGACGIEGAAIAWFARVSVDTIILLWMAKWLLPKTAHFIRRMAWILGAGLLILSFPMFPISILMNRVFLLFMLVTFPFVAWIFILAPEERLYAQELLKSRDILSKE